MRKMRILFLHGLESKPGCEKVQLLQSLGHIVQSPRIEYKDDKSYENLYKLTRHNNYDVIIGSSMGGWFAWNLGKELGVPVLLLNPALHSRSVDPNMDLGVRSVLGPFPRTSKVFLALGLYDDIISPDKTLEWLKHNDKLDWNPNNIKVAGYGHRTSTDMFIDIWFHFEQDIINVNKLYEV
jgi:hypothetical protein